MSKEYDIYPLLSVNADGALSVRAVNPAVHTMGHRLADYVLPKVPAEVTRRALVRTGCRLEDFVSVGKHEGKRFNWRRPLFSHEGELTICTTAPGRDYAYHYAGLVATACQLRGHQASVTVELPAPDDALRFVKALLPADLPALDVVIVGYVEPLFRTDRTPWVIDSGFGWSIATVAGRRVGLLGCEFSYWGDLAGAMVTTLAGCGVRRVVYVGKLGGLDPTRPPNRFSATGTCSLLGRRLIVWPSRLAEQAAGFEGVLTEQAHATVPSILDETLAWYVDHAGRVDLVDPEIGHMAAAATIEAGIEFDYLHIISDNLAGGYAQGLYDERSADVATERARRVIVIEEILKRSLRSC